MQNYQNYPGTDHSLLKSSSQTAIREYLEGNGSSLQIPLIKESLGLKITISVVIPVYNEMSVVGRILQALNKQTSNNFEVIIVDNGSTDETCRVVKDFRRKANYPLYVISEPNPGVANARKRGMDEVLIRLLKRGSNFHHFLAVTDADTILPEDWLVRIGKGFEKANIGGLAGTHEASEEVERKIGKATGISNYFNLIPSLIEFLERNGFGSIKMSGPNSAFTSFAYALGDGIEQEYDSQGKPKLNEVNNLGRRIRNLGYTIAPMWCRLIKSRRRELFEIINNGEDSYFPKGHFPDGRFNIIREDEMTLLGTACKAVPRTTWENYRYKMIYKVIRNFVFQPLALGAIEKEDIQHLFTPEEIKIFSFNSLFPLTNQYAFNVLKGFLSRVESKL